LADELRQNFLLVEPQWIVTQPQNLPVVEKALNCEEISKKPKILSLEDELFEKIFHGDKVDPHTFQPVEIKDPESHVFANLFSSGTTGEQKAIMITDYPYIRKIYAARYANTEKNGFVTAIKLGTTNEFFCCFNQKF